MNPFILGLRSLRAIDAAGRHLSFTNAAGELSVTPAAISHQIKDIEGQLGFQLFRRGTRHFELTKDGETFHKAVGNALAALQFTIDRIERQAALELQVSASPSITAKWLAPRLDTFFAQFPNSNIRVHVSPAPLELLRDDADVAIWFCDGKYPGLQSFRLFEERVFPVCSPSMLAGATPLVAPSDLLNHNLIHMDWEAQGATWPNWPMWLAAAGVSSQDTTRGLHYNQVSLALEAAISGQGVALGESTVVADDLASGRLVRPFNLALSVSPEYAYHLVARPAAFKFPLVKAFQPWILEQAAATNLQYLPRT